MKFDNQTVWSTEAISRVLGACLVHDDFQPPAGAVVRIVYSRKHDRRLVYSQKGKEVFHSVDSAGVMTVGRGSVRGTKPTYSGWARYGAGHGGDGRRTGKHGCAMLLRLPHPEHVDSKLDPAQVALLVRHEVGHWRGLRHRQMSGMLLDWPRVGAELPGWAEGIEIPLHVRPEPAKLAPEERRERIAACAATQAGKREERARKMLAHFEHGLKLSAAGVKRWKEKVRYYDRKKKVEP